jgi:hypothetical protein
LPPETPKILWTLHHNVLSRGRPVLAVRRRVLPGASGDTTLRFTLGRGGEAFVSREALALCGMARSCRGPATGAWHPLLQVFDHPPSAEERRAWLLRRPREQAALASRPAPVWLIVPGDIDGPDRALRCATRRSEHLGEGTSRLDLELRLPFRGYQGAPLLCLLDLAVGGMAQLSLLRSRFVACAVEPSAALLAQSAAERRGRPEEAWFREDAATLLGPPRTAAITTGEAAIAELGLTLPCSAEEVGRAFRRRIIAERAHPDQGGSDEEFRELSRIKALALAHLDRKCLPAKSAA